MNFTEALQRAAADYGLTLSDEQQQQFTRYYELLIEWNQKINLTAITEPCDVAVKHIIDSLSCYDKMLFLPHAKVIDVGTGAGFPGIPLKIWRPDLQLTLLDSLNKRLIYLKEVVEQLGLKQVTLVHSRAEDGAHDRKLRESFSIVTSRAVARMTVLTELCLPLVCPGGHFLALKGKDTLNEVEAAKKAIRVLGGDVMAIRPVHLPGLDDERNIVIVKKLRPSPSHYPRRPAIIEKKPL